MSRAARSRVVFLCGPSGAGKSILARRYEREGYTRLSFDVEAWARGVRSLPVPAEVVGPVDAHLRARLADLLGAGRDVVVDLSFSTRAVRAQWRALVAPFGVVPRTVYVSVDRSTALERLARRRDEGPDDYRLDPATAAAHHDTFEVPTPEEGPLTVVDGTAS